MLLEVKFQLTSVATVALLHIRVRNWMHTWHELLCFSLHCGPLTVPPFPQFFSPLLHRHKFHPSSSHVPPSFSPTSRGSFAWEDRLMWAILPNRSYMSATWWNWFSTPTTFFSLRKIPLPYGSHLFFMLPPSLLEINGREEVRLQGLRFDMYDSSHAYIYDECACVPQGWRWDSCQQDSQGKVMNPVVCVTPPASCGIVCCRGLSPALPWRPINSSKQLTQHSVQWNWYAEMLVSFSACCFSQCWLVCFFFFFECSSYGSVSLVVCIVWQKTYFGLFLQKKKRQITSGWFHLFISFFPFPFFFKGRYSGTYLLVKRQ